LKQLCSILLLLALGGCSKLETPTQWLPLYQLNGVEVKIGPEPVLVEQVLTLTVTLPADYQVQQAQVVGLSMAMGIIPLAFTRDKDGYRAEFVLGACSEPNMQWQLELTVVGPDGASVQLKLPFHSAWRA